MMCGRSTAISCGVGILLESGQLMSGTVTTMLPAQWVAHVQAAVVAISARHNVMDSMEKRVRSQILPQEGHHSGAGH